MQAGIVGEKYTTITETMGFQNIVSNLYTKFTFFGDIFKSSLGY